MDYSKYFSVIDYYERFVIPLNPSRYKVKSDKMMVCPCHNDHDPSLGIVHTKDGELVHCFGCNFWGDIVKLHQRVNKRLLKKYLSEEEALKDLCRVMGVDYNKLPKESPEGEAVGSENADLRQELELEKALDRFDLQDFKHMILEGKRNKKGVAYFNTLMMIMVNEVSKEDGV